MPDFSNKNKFKINNPYGEGNHDTSSKHGTNANYKKTGAPNLLKNIGNAMTGGLAGKLFGGIKNKMNNMTNQNQNAVNAVNNANTMDSAPPVDPVNTNAIDPAMSGAPMYGKKKGAPMYGKKKGAPKHKKGAPKLKGNQHKIDKNKDGKISKADFNMINKKK